MEELSDLEQFLGAELARTLRRELAAPAAEAAAILASFPAPGTKTAARNLALVVDIVEAHVQTQVRTDLQRRQR